MKKIILFLFAASIIFSLSNCGNRNEKEITDAKPTEEETSDSDETSIDIDIEDMDINKKYGVKSGTLTQETAIMGFNQGITMYWDDWGDKQFTEINDEVMGQKIHNITIMKGNVHYEIDMIEKTGTKQKIDIESKDNINFQTLTQPMIDRFNIKEKGTETLLDKECKVYIMEFESPEDGSLMEAELWVWKGISLKVETTVMGVFGATVETTSIKTDIDVPSNQFAIPEGIKWTEIDINIEM
jgi:hypothetical protein